jgi:hypothetical protein
MRQGDIGGKTAGSPETRAGTPRVPVRFRCVCAIGLNDGKKQVLSESKIADKNNTSPFSNIDYG